jgi:hypothetical protein
MSLAINQNSGPKKDYGRVADDNYPARIVQCIDLGRQHVEFWKDNKPLYYILDDEGKPIKGENNKSTEVSDIPVIQPKVWITFEFPTETIEIDGEDRPRWYSKEYTVSAHEKAALMALIKAANPDAERISDLLGCPVMVEIGSTSSGKAKVVGTSKVPKMITVPKLGNDVAKFDLDKPDLDVYNSLPAFLKEKIKSGVDFEKTKLYTMLQGEKEDIPFGEGEEEDAPF